MNCYRKRQLILKETEETLEKTMIQTAESRSRGADRMATNVKCFVFISEHYGG